MYDLIRKKAAINTIHNMYCRWDGEEPNDLRNMLLTAFQELPTIDAVPVVRCKDCKHRPKMIENVRGYRGSFDIDFPDDVCPCQCEDHWYSWVPKDDWFCANGET